MMLQVAGVLPGVFDIGDPGVARVPLYLPLMAEELLLKAMVTRPSTCLLVSLIDIFAAAVAAWHFTQVSRAPIPPHE